MKASGQKVRPAVTRTLDPSVLGKSSGTTILAPETAPPSSFVPTTQGGGGGPHITVR